MTKTSSFRRLFPCFTATPTTPTAPSATNATKKRLSASLRDDIPQATNTTSAAAADQEDAGSTSSNDSVSSQAPPRPSKSMVICTFFGPRRSHVWFCVQLDRLSAKPSLLLELSITTQSLIKEMQSGFVRIALESDGSGLSQYPLHSIPTWVMYCNGRKIGFATRRKATTETREILKKMKSMTVGAGVIPSESGSDPADSAQGGGILYMRANYEWVVGGADSESYHLVNPDDEGSGQDLSVFLLRSRS